MADKIYSQDSGVAPYETFFHDFDLEAFSFFNYWTDDEDVNDTNELGSLDINEMPRFVKLTWNQAPDLPEEKEAYEKANPPSLGRRSEGAGVAGAEEQFIVEGTAYSPDQIKPKEFASVAAHLANSDIAPGVIDSVVSLPLVSSGYVSPPPAYRIDLDTWYALNRSRGSLISNVRGGFNNRASGFFNLPKIYRSGVSGRVAPAYNEIFTGNFTFSPSSFVNRRMTVSSANSSAMSMRSAPAVSNRRGTSEPIREIFEEITYDRVPRTASSVKVSFVDTGIGRVASPERLSAATSAAHVAAIAATSQVLRNLITYSESGLQNSKRKIKVRSFDAPNGISSKEYVGYLIEKYEQVGGVFKLKELIGIGDPYADEFYDTKVRYGGIYRYRIRSVMRWVRPKSVGAEGSDPSMASSVGSDSASSNTADTSLTPNFASYFGSQWSKNWATAHIIDDTPPDAPDQLCVLPQSEKKRIVVSFQMPENAQRDIYQMSLFRRVVDRNGRDVVPWTKIDDFDMSRAGFYIDYDVEFIPSTPEKLGFKPVAPYRYVYAAVSYSVHNGVSKLSEQLGARLNSDWEQRGEHPVEFFSSRGVDLEADHGIFSTIPVKQYKTHIVVTPKSDYDVNLPAEVSIKGQERWGTRMLCGNAYILRFHSLDTGETYDIDFGMSMVNLDAYKISVPTNIYVPSAGEQYVYDDQASIAG